MAKGAVVEGSNKVITINEGDVITILIQGMQVTGRVTSSAHYGKDGWYIELTNANVLGGYSYWKQGYDGGKVVIINDKRV